MRRARGDSPLLQDDGLVVDAVGVDLEVDAAEKNPVHALVEKERARHDGQILRYVTANLRRSCSTGNRDAAAGPSSSPPTAARTVRGGRRGRQTPAAAAEMGGPPELPFSAPTAHSVDFDAEETRAAAAAKSWARFCCCLRLFPFRFRRGGSTFSSADNDQFQFDSPAAMRTNGVEISELLQNFAADVDNESDLPPTDRKVLEKAVRNDEETRSVRGNSGGRRSRRRRRSMNLDEDGVGLSVVVPGEEAASKSSSAAVGSSRLLSQEGLLVRAVLRAQALRFGAVAERERQAQNSRNRASSSSTSRGAAAAEAQAEDALYLSYRLAPPTLGQDRAWRERVQNALNSWYVAEYVHQANKAALRTASTAPREPPENQNANVKKAVMLPRPRAPIFSESEFAKARFFAKTIGEMVFCASKQNPLDRNFRHVVFLGDSGFRLPLIIPPAEEIVEELSSGGSSKKKKAAPLKAKAAQQLSAAAAARGSAADRRMEARFFCTVSDTKLTRDYYCDDAGGAPMNRESLYFVDDLCARGAFDVTAAAASGSQSSSPLNKSPSPASPASAGAATPSSGGNKNSPDQADNSPTSDHAATPQTSDHLHTDEHLRNFQVLQVLHAWLRQVQPGGCRENGELFAESQTPLLIVWERDSMYRDVEKMADLFHAIFQHFPRSAVLCDVLVGGGNNADGGNGAATAVRSRSQTSSRENAETPDWRRKKPRINEDEALFVQAVGAAYAVADHEEASAAATTPASASGSTSASTRSRRVRAETAAVATSTPSRPSTFLYPAAVDVEDFASGCGFRIAKQWTLNLDNSNHDNAKNSSHNGSEDSKNLFATSFVKVVPYGPVVGSEREQTSSLYDEVDLRQSASLAANVWTRRAPEMNDESDWRALLLENRTGGYRLAVAGRGSGKRYAIPARVYGFGEEDGDHDGKDEESD